MAIERTFSMLKPGVAQRRLMGEIISRIERKGLKIVAMKMRAIDRTLAAAHYAEHEGKPFYAPLIDYIVSGPVVAMAIEGEDAIAALRRLIGPTNAAEAQPGTVRGDFGVRTRLNLIHASDSPESAARELALYFEESDYAEWEDPNHAWY
jgi:nucleoside-diphosphate kinase